MRIWASDTDYDPWYSLCDDAAHAEMYGYAALDVPGETVRRWRDAIAAAEDAQREIRKLAEAAAVEEAIREGRGGPGTEQPR
jgi:hypothetical protein